MCARPVLSSVAVRAAEADLDELIRSRIRRLLHDPAVIKRVSRRLDSATVRRSAGMPVCFSRRSGNSLEDENRVIRFSCRSCSAIDCLCGRLPTHLTTRDIENAGIPQRLRA